MLLKRHRIKKGKDYRREQESICWRCLNNEICATFGSVVYNKRATLVLVQREKRISLHLIIITMNKRCYKKNRKLYI